MGSPSFHRRHKSKLYPSTVWMGPSSEGLYCRGWGHQQGRRHALCLNPTTAWHDMRERLPGLGRRMLALSLSSLECVMDHRCGANIGAVLGGRGSSKLPWSHHSEDESRPGPPNCISVACLLTFKSLLLGKPVWAEVCEENGAETSLDLAFPSSLHPICFLFRERKSSLMSQHNKNINSFSQRK